MAQTTRQTDEVREFYGGARAQAMGGARVAVVNDETALFHNPAALGKLRDFYGTLFDPEIEGSTGFSTAYTKRAPSSAFEASSVAATLDSNRESNYHVQAQVFPSVVAKNFGIGIYGRKLLDAYLDATATNMQTYSVDDVAVLLGYNLRLWDGRIKIGVVGKAISRIEVDGNFPVASLDIEGNTTEGLGVGADAGLMLTAPWTWLPTLTGVVRDVGGTRFEAGSGLRKKTTNRPAKMDQDIDVGIAVFPIHSNNVRSSFTLEVQKLTAMQKATDKTRFYHLGYEFNLYDVFFLRAGMNQRYWTAGVEYATERTQVQLTSYGEDIGIDGTPVEDRRMILKFAFRF